MPDSFHSLTKHAVDSADVQGRNFGCEAAIGRHRGLRIDIAAGHNPSIRPQEGLLMVWNGIFRADWVRDTAGPGWTITYANPADATREIILVGLDANNKIQEVILPPGTTAAGSWSIVWFMGFGQNSSGKALADITLRGPTAKVQARIEAGETVSHNGFVQIPDNTKGLVSNAILRTSHPNVRVWAGIIQPGSTSDSFLKVIELAPGNNTFDPPFVVQPGTVIGLKAMSMGGNRWASGHFNIVLVSGEHHQLGQPFFKETPD